MAKLLGKLKQIDPRIFFGEEAESFSMWLAQDEILQMLGETVGFELELGNGSAPMEVPKGGVLVRHVAKDEPVIIQGQLEGTDHEEFGKLITYAAGLNAKTVIWIGSKISEEHRRALEWLNQVTDDSVNFYGTEMELWQIDDSAPAPKFNLICQPTSWAKSLKAGREDHEPVNGDKEKVKPKAKAIPGEEKIEQEVPEAPVKQQTVLAPKSTKPQNQQSQSKEGEKEGVSVRQNFVYTTKNWPKN